MSKKTRTRDENPITDAIARLEADVQFLSEVSAGAKLSAKSQGLLVEEIDVALDRLLGSFANLRNVWYGEATDETLGHDE